MLTYIILLWILLHLSAPAWCFVLLGIAALTKAIKVGMDLKNSGKGA